MLKPKEFKLSEAHKNLILYTHKHTQALVAGVISHVATDLGEPITEHTKFELSDDASTLKIIQDTKEQPKKDAVVSAE